MLLLVLGRVNCGVFIRMSIVLCSVYILFEFLFLYIRITHFFTRLSYIVTLFLVQV